MGASSSSPGTSRLSSYITRALILSIIIFAILVIVHFTIRPVFSFSSADMGFIKVPVSSDKQVAFDKAPAGLDASANLVNVVPCGYTMSMDLYITGAFATSNSPRVILYNSNSRVAGGEFTEKNLNTKFPNSNVIMWLDPAVNDLYISTITVDMANNNKVHIETIPPIENVPMKTPFRVTYVYTQHFIEVYMNGALHNTMPYKNNAQVSSSSFPFFFGHVSSRTSCLAGNVFYWPRVLTSREVRAAGAPVSSTAFFSS